MRRKISFLFPILIELIFCVSGTNGQNTYITTIHPFTTILRPLLPDSYPIMELLPPGASPHTFELRPSDVREIAAARALVFGGENLDDWVLKAQTEQRINLQLLIPDSLRLYMDKNRQVIDPHFWTDPLTVAAVLPGLVERLCDLESADCSQIRRNRKVFEAKLYQLDREIRQQLSRLENRNIIVSHPFLEYFIRRYQLNLIGVVEYQPGREPGPRELAKLLETGRRHNIRAIYVHGQHEARSAAVLADGLGIPVIMLDPVGDPDVTPGYAQLLQRIANRILETQQ